MSSSKGTPPCSPVRDPLSTRVLVVGPDSNALRKISDLIDGLDEIELLDVVAPMGCAVDVAESDPPSVVVVVTESEGPRLWRTVMGLARPPLHLPVLLVGPESVRTTGFLIGAEDWLPIETVTSALLKRTVGNAVIRRRVAGGLPAQGHLHGLVSGMAHEVNNPLTVIIADLEDIHERISEQRAECSSPALVEELSEISEMLSDDLTAAHRIKTLARALQDLARLADTVPSALHTGPALRRVLARVSARYPRGPLPRIAGDVETTVHAAVHGFEEALYQVIANAMQAHAEAGIDLPVRVQVDASSDLVEITVRDQGAGIPRDIVDKVLSPFKSGRPPGEGLGLGLTLAALALRRAGGDVAIAQPPMGGTEVVLAFLPARASLSPSIEMDFDDDEEDVTLAAR